MTEERDELPREDCLTTLTIYAHPRDFPGGYVVRRWYTPPSPAPGVFAEPVPSPKAYGCATLDAARTLARELGGSYPIARSPGDDPCIVETWL